MQRRRCAIVIVVALCAAACATSPGGAPPAFTPSIGRDECLRTGGAWRDVLRFCEYR